MSTKSARGNVRMIVDPEETQELVVSDVRALRETFSDTVPRAASERPSSRARPSEEELRARLGFLRALCRELDNPVAALDACVLLLSDAPERLDGERAATLEAARQSVERLQRFAADLRTVASGQAGYEVQQEPVKVHVLVRELFEELGPRAELRQIRTRANVPPAVVLNANAPLLRGCFRHLIRQLVRHVPRGGSIHVRGRVGVAVELLFDAEGAPDAPIAPAPPSEAADRALLEEALELCQLALQAHGGSLAVEGWSGAGLRVRVSLAARAISATDGP